MTDLSQLSNEELMALYQGQSQAPDVRALVTAAAQRHGVDPGLAMRVAKQESGYRTNAVSPKGARGPMQLMPATARELGVDMNDPAQNVDGGVRYLKQQLDTFGSPELALAAYNAGPGAVRKYGGIPPYAETQNYVQSIQGGAAEPAPPAGDLSGMSDAELQALYAQGEPAAIPSNIIASSHNGGVTIELGEPEPTRPPTKLRPDDKLGLLKGAYKPIDNASDALVGMIRGSGVEAPLAAAGRGLRKALPDGLVDFIDDPAAYYKAQSARGVRPGKLGEFAGNVLGTLPLAALPGGVMTQGAAMGAALTDAKDAGGVMRDAAIGAVAGKVGEKAFGAAGRGVQNLLSKAPKIMSLPQLQAAKQAAYDAVDAAGITFPKAQVASLAKNFSAVVNGSALSKSAKDDAASIIQYTQGLGKGKLTLSQLEKLRGDIYEAMVAKGGDTAKVGGAFRAEITAMIDAVDNGLVRNARDLNTRFAKSGAVMKRLESADLARGRAYTGKNTDNTIRQKLSPLVDPMHSARLRNATPDEAAALKRVVTGSPAQNAVRTAGTLLDPRGVIGMGLQATGAAKSGGLSLASVPLGLASTAASGRMSQKNVEELLKLIAAGGSRQALKRQATPASQAVQKATAKARPVFGRVGAAAAATRD